MTDQITGQRTLLTILFVDIAGSTELFTRYDDEDVSAIYKSFRIDATAIVENNGGFVNQSLGDGLMIIFGLEKAHEKHALMACQSASELHEAFYNIDLRIGIHTGSAIVEKKESPAGPLLTIAGFAVNAAAKLGAAAGARETLISQETLNNVAQNVEATFHAEQQIGDELLKTHQFIALRQNADAYTKDASPLNDFVGRDFELATLLHRFRQADSPGPEINLVAGAAGLGKSRLLAEFRAQLDAGIPVLHYNFLPSGTIRSNFFKSLFRQCLALSNTDAATLLATLNFTNALMHQAWHEMNDAAETDEAWRKLDHNTKLNFKAAVIWHVLETLPKPLVLIFEDTHWADQEVRFFLNARRGAGKIFILLSSRDPHAFASFEGQPLFSRLVLGTLSEGTGRALLEKWLGTSVTLGILKRDILSAAGGNPLFLHEMVASLLASNQLVGRIGNFICVDKNSSFAVPTSIKSLISTRVQSLDRDLQDTMAAMAVIGLRFDRALLARITRLHESTLDRHIAALKNHSLLVQENNVFADHYYFAHALIHDGAYDTILKSRRLDLHRQVFAALSAQPGRRRKNLTLLAHHSFQAQLYREAFAHNYLAGQQALANADGVGATEFYRQACAALEALPPDFANRDRYLVKSQLGLATALSIQNEHVAAKAVMEKIGRDLAELDDAGNKLKNKLRSLELFDVWAQGALTKGIELGYAFIKTLDLQSDPYNYVTTAIRLGGMLQDQGRYVESNEVLLPLRNFFDAENQSRYGLLFPAAPVCFAIKSRNSGELGDFEQAEIFSKISFDFLKNNKNILGHIYSLSYGSTYLIREEKYEMALPFFREAYELAVQIKNNLLYPFTATHYGFCLFNTGKKAEGMAIMEESWQIAQRQSAIVRQSLYAQILSESKLLNQNYLQAKQLSITTIAMGNSYSENANIARSYYVTGVAEYYLNKANSSEAFYFIKMAQTMASNMRLLPLFKICERALADFEMA